MRQSDPKLGEILGDKTRDVCCWHHEGKELKNGPDRGQIFIRNQGLQIQTENEKL